MGKHSTKKSKNTNAGQEKSLSAHESLADQTMEETSCVFIGESYDKFINRWSNTVQKELLNQEKTNNAEEK